MPDWLCLNDLENLGKLIFPRAYLQKYSSFRVGLSDLFVKHHIIVKLSDNRKFKEKNKRKTNVSSNPNSQILLLLTFWVILFLIYWINLYILSYNPYKFVLIYWGHIYKSTHKNICIYVEVFDDNHRIL